MSTAADCWFVLNRGKITGPHTHVQLETMRQQGVCNSFTKISQDQQQWIGLDEYLRDVRTQASAPAPLRPPPLNGATFRPGESPESAGQRLAKVRAHDVLRSFPILPLILLHYLTAGIFSFFWVTALHGKLPKARTDDPSAAKAISLCLVPFFNLYWFFIVYPRLAARVNALSTHHRLQPIVPVPLSYIMAILMVVPVAMATAGSFILMFLFASPTSKTEISLLFFAIPNALTLLNYLAVAPSFAERLQRSINDISDAQISELCAGQTT